jgi:hypothetical protein
MRRGLAATAVAVMVLAIVGAPASAAGGTWHVVPVEPVPSGQDSAFAAIHAVGRHAVFAVGRRNGR